MPPVLRQRPLPALCKAGVIISKVREEHLAMFRQQVTWIVK